MPQDWPLQRPRPRLAPGSRDQRLAAATCTWQPRPSPGSRDHARSRDHGPTAVDRSQHPLPITRRWRLLARPLTYPPAGRRYSPLLAATRRYSPLLEDPLHRRPHGIPIHRLGEEMDAGFLRDCQTP